MSAQSPQNAGRNSRAFLAVAALLATTFFVPLRANAPPIDWGQVHEITMRGIDNLYNLEMERARLSFDSVITLAPGDPRGQFFRSITHFWTYTLQNDEQEFVRFISHSDSVVEICEHLLDQNPGDAGVMFYLGGIHGYRGLAQQLHGSVLNAVLEGRKGYRYLEEAVRLRPDLSDAQMGFGLFRYFVAKVPRGFGWVARLLGFDGDLEGGLESLRIASTKGTYTKSEATFYLAQFLYNEHRHEEAFALMRSLLAKYPENTLFHVLYASWLFRDNRLDEASESIRNASAINARKTIKIGEEFIYSTRGSIAYTRNDFASARDDYGIFLEKIAQRDKIPAVTYYRIAVAREIMGDRVGSLAICREIEKTAGRGGWNEEYFQRKGRELQEQPLRPAEIWSIRGGNDFTRKAFDTAVVDYRRAVEAAGSEPDLRARALYGLQQSFFEKGDDTQAIALGREVVSLAPARETWTIPHAWVLLARSLARIGQRTEALEALKRAEGFDDYDFQQSLEAHINTERRNLEEKQ
jgi:tetratricopeptide (TPR) repeat protein